MVTLSLTNSIVISIQYYNNIIITRIIKITTIIVNKTGENHNATCTKTEIK